MVITQVSSLREVLGFPKLVDVGHADTASWDRDTNNKLELALRHHDSVVKLPVFQGSEGEHAFDINKLRTAENGLPVTFDHGLGNTASCLSALTYINGEGDGEGKGILRYRGYPIEEIVERMSFEETALMLFDHENANVPDQATVTDFDQALVKAMDLPQDIKQLIDRAPKKAHPMQTLAAVSSMLAAHDQGDEKANAIKMMGALTAAAARIFRNRSHESIVDIQVDSDKNFVQNFINMMYGDAQGGLKLPKGLDVQEIESVFNKLLILHADHEQNCSTSTVRMVASSKANPFAAIAAGIAALSGPAHGGANEAVLVQLRAMKDRVDTGESLDDVIQEMITKALDKTGKIMGVGHRVYKAGDPRADALRTAAGQILPKVQGGNEAELLQIADKLRLAVEANPGLHAKKLYPNVDFYSGILYKALDIPEEMMTVMFALGRLPGWLAHMQEQARDQGGTDKMKIWRPRQIYTGHKERHLATGKQPFAPGMAV